MMTILRLALFSLLLINLCQAGDDGVREEKFGTDGHQTPVIQVDIASEIVADIQKMESKKKSAFQQHSVDIPYNRADWPSLCMMRSLIDAIQTDTPGVISAFKEKVNEVRSHKKFDEDENWTFDYLSGKVSATLSNGI